MGQPRQESHGSSPATSQQAHKAGNIDQAYSVDAERVRHTQRRKGLDDPAQARNAGGSQLFTERNLDEPKTAKKLVYVSADGVCLCQKHEGNSDPQERQRSRRCRFANEITESTTQALAD